MVVFFLRSTLSSCSAEVANLDSTIGVKVEAGSREAAVEVAPAVNVVHSLGRLLQVADGKPCGDRAVTQLMEETVREALLRFAV